MMTKQKIIKNMAQCLLCGDVIESKYRHDYRSCKCLNLSIDGGHFYIKRSLKILSKDGLETYKELSQACSCEDCSDCIRNCEHKK